jgi:predicted NBD/HSP70 family sugar kinase
LLVLRGFAVGLRIKIIKKGAIHSMEDIEKVLEQIKEWVRKLIEGLVNPEPQPELIPIPVPVNQPRHRR